MSNQTKREKLDPFYFSNDSLYYIPELSLWQKAQGVRVKDTPSQDTAKGYYLLKIPNSSELALKPKQMSQKENVRELAKTLCKKYPSISTNENVFKGKPHLKNTRFTVADVLSAICIHDSLKDVMDAYENNYTEKQLKEAIRYVRDFLLSAYSLR